jgi:tetratricopeptide (TPR) repeat protein
MPSLDAAARERDGVGRSSGVGWRPPARNLAELLRTAHKHRMGKDCYTFLDLKPQASKDEIKQAYHRLVRVWEAAGQDPEIPADARDAAGELVAAAIFAFRTLTDDERRVEYDRRMERGQAPLLTGLHGADASQITNTNANIRSVPASTNPAIRAMPKSSPGMPAASPKMDEVRRLMDKGDFGAAMPLLQALRLESPSSADVLADLGWCVWKLRNRRDGADDEADEYLQLAATFDPKHVRALEYLARMAKDRGDLEGARRRVRRLLEVDPRNAWARGAQKSLEEASPEADQSAPGAALRFWKRRG